MKKLIIILLLFTPSLFADDYLDSLQEMSVTVKQNLNFASNSPNVPDSLVFSKIRETYALFSNWVFANEIVETLITTSGVLDYAYDSLVKINEVFWKKKDSLMSLTFEKKSNWINIFNRPVLLSENDNYLAHSTYYDQTTGRIQFYPTPDKVDTFIIYGLGKVTNIISDSTFVTQFPITYRPAVLDYATFKVALAKQMWQSASFWGNTAANSIRMIDSTIDMREYGF